MKNNKGMTIVELIVCLILVSVMMIFLLNLLITVQNFSVQNQNVTDLLVNQSVVIKALEKDMNEYKLKGVSTCTTEDLSQDKRYPIVSNDYSNLYCLKLTYDNSLLEENVGYLVQYTYNYTEFESKNVVGYKRGSNQTIRESKISMDPNNYLGYVTTSCKNVSSSSCSLKITMPIFDEIGTNYDIVATYIYNSSDFNYQPGSAYGFVINEGASPTPGPSNTIDVDITALKANSGTTVLTNTISNEGLNFKFSAINARGSYTIKYCKDTINSCNPNLTATPDATITSYNTDTGIYYIRYKIESNGSSSAVKTYTANVVTTLSGNLSFGCSAADPLTAPLKESATTDEGMHQTEDDYGTSCYYRGAVENNYLLFAEKCWRIVRVLGNGDIKLVLYNYNPNNVTNPCNETGDYLAFTNGKDSQTRFNLKYYEKSAGPAFMYGLVNGNPTIESNEYDSDVLAGLKDWYDKNFTNAEKNMLADDIWCNDKRIVSPASNSAWSVLYAATNRLTNDGANANPSLKCGTSKTDNLISKYTASSTTDNGYGNGDLNGYKVGLLTMDEVAFAGATGRGTGYTITEYNNYLRKNTSSDSFGRWWTMTPAYFSGGCNVTTNVCKYESFAIVMDEYNVLRSYSTAAYPQLRPSIVLKSSVNATGSGTATDPYVVNSNQINDNIVCNAGTYLPANSRICASCPAGSFCIGGTYTKGNSDQGIAKCAVGSYTDTTGQSTCKACQPSGETGRSGTTNGEGQTSCNANCGKTGVATWNAASWSNNNVSGRCSINTCATNYSLINGNCVRTTCTVYCTSSDNCTAQKPTSGVYGSFTCNNGKTGSIQSCFYNNTTCDGGNYYRGKNATYLCTAGTYSYNVYYTCNTSLDSSISAKGPFLRGSNYNCSC